MKIKLTPIYFDPGRDEGFDTQLKALRSLLSDGVEFLTPVALGEAIPACDAVVFPQFLGEGYRRLADFKALTLPILVITSEFGTLSMWDWELISYLRNEGVRTIAPYSLEQTRKIIAALGVKRELKKTKFLVYQDNPGEGQQAPIFKRFFWWENECTQRMVAKFGVTIEKRSYKELGARAKTLSDADADAAEKQRPTPVNGLSERARRAASKLYLAVKHDLDADPSIRAVGMNCLNESHFSDSTPCMAYNRLFSEGRYIWGCEGDTVSMLTKYVLYHSLGAPIMMTNLYPFLLGNAALKHERIEAFPKVKGDPKDYILVAHCGYMGVIPEEFATEWALKPKVLRIVDEHASAIDARIPTGAITLAKMSPSFDSITVAEGDLEGYAQYPGSDCQNGGIVHVANGHRLMSSLSSHHALLMNGHQFADLDTIAPIFGLNLNSI